LVRVSPHGSLPKSSPLNNTIYTLNSINCCVLHKKHGIDINYTLCLCYLAWIVDGHGIKQNDATFSEIPSKLNLFHDLCGQLQHNFIEI
jgi:hypothetical protein